MGKRVLRFFETESVARCLGWKESRPTKIFLFPFFLFVDDHNTFDDPQENPASSTKQSKASAPKKSHHHSDQSSATTPTSRDAIVFVQVKVVIMNWDSVIEWVGIVLLFCLVFGMSATVDINQLKQQIRNKEAILTGLIVQFLIMPLVGFWAVVSFSLDRATGITLLVITTSPGGSYSNWWCSMFNADLALSVTMTAISTAVSAVMMPLNLYVYAKFAFEDDILQDLNWGSLIFVSAT